MFELSGWHILIYWTILIIKFNVLDAFYNTLGYNLSDGAINICNRIVSILFLLWAMAGVALGVGMIFCEFNGWLITIHSLVTIFLYLMAFFTVAFSWPWHDLMRDEDNEET